MNMRINEKYSLPAGSRASLYLKKKTVNSNKVLYRQHIFRPCTLRILLIIYEKQDIQLTKQILNTAKLVMKENPQRAPPCVQYPTLKSVCDLQKLFELMKLVIVKSTSSFTVFYVILHKQLQSLHLYGKWKKLAFGSLLGNADNDKIKTKT